MTTNIIDRQKLAGTGVSEAHAKSLLDTIDNSISQGNITQDTSDHGLTGFVNGANNPDSIIAFDASTRIFSITPTGDSFSYWANGVKYTKTSAQTITIPDSEGAHYIYFQAGTLTSTQVFTSTIIIECAIVSIVIWDKVNSKCVGWAEERHARVMSGETHLSLHTTPGTIFVHGCDLGHSAKSSGAPANDTYSKVYVGIGTVRDEDINVTSINSATPSGRFEQILGSNLTTDAAKLPVISLEGASGYWRKWDNDSDRFAFQHNGSNTPPYFNEFTGGAWQLSPVTNRDFVVYYVCQWTDYEYPVFLMIGQSKYDKLKDAKKATASELDWGIYNPAELIILHKLIFEYRTAYTNATHRCVLRKIESYNVAGTSKVALINANQNHASLQNLDYETAGHIDFTRSIYITTSDPTTDNDDVDTADIDRAFNNGEFWYNSTGTKLFVCVDNSTSAAVWKQISLV